MLYGCLGNKFFKFFDIRLAESTTRCGQNLLMHMVRTVAKQLDGEYKYPSESTIYSDTDSVDKNSIVKINGVDDSIENMFNRYADIFEIITNNNGNEILNITGNLFTPTLIGDSVQSSKIRTIYRHKVKKLKYTINTSTGNTVTVTDDHSLMVYRNNVLLEIKPSEILQNDKFIETVNSGRCADILKSNILSVEWFNDDKEDYVYDIVMEDEKYPYFFANNILVHNSCYFKTYADNLDTAIKVGNAIQDKVNKAFPIFCADAFLCNDYHKNFISAELDVIASKSIFIKKKYYVMNLEYSEGTRVDKMKLMGVQLKKTTIPKKVSEELTKFVKELLKGKEWKDVGEDIVNYKEFILNEAPIELIGLPKGIAGLEEKEREYTNGNTDVMLSGHAAASIFYNICLEKYQDKESFKIKSGMKIKVYYLKQKFGRFTSIALPTDIKNIPEWFIDNFSGIIDRERQAEVLITKPLQNIFQAIDKNVPTRKTLLFDELVSY